ncbi:carboxypeptidase-like regulatory domain-containing protein [Euryarchaeota archaeon]|nr:carboxypeptidase-like regulatory domain-containing protein [Euryarchaeota archaeon]
MTEENINNSGFELWLYDLSIDPATRVAGAILIIAGSALGAMLGVLLMAADPADIMGQIEDEQSSDDVNGLVISSLENNTGGDPIEGILVELLNEDRTLISSDITDSGGRFSIDDVPRQSSILHIQHSDNKTVEIFLIPGDHSQIPITLVPGDGLISLDMRGESNLSYSVFVGLFIATMTLITGLAGIIGGLETYNGNKYRRSWWLAFFGLFSRGMIFIGPLLILLGLGLMYMTRDQFTDYYSSED